ncbi:MAG: hypothetical protein N5P05_001445 [Chroococcopsis gigantea SAG 12.99]|nr:cytochrome c [Chlorogloea purpurea SAG 13.99]MDV2999839.1 hypothetical protein [Chroococcopsis gigantea SAG 12.99]
MDSQLAKPKSRFPSVVVGVIVLVSLVISLWAGYYYYETSNPYIKEVLALKGDANRGYQIFQINCAACHGKEADGVVGPSLHYVSKRKSYIDLIDQVTSGKTPPMPKFQPDGQTMADLLEYLHNL